MTIKHHPWQNTLGDGMRLEALRTYFGHASTEASAKRFSRQDRDVSARRHDCLANGSCTASSQPSAVNGNGLYDQELSFTLNCSADTVCIWDTKV